MIEIPRLGNANIAIRNLSYSTFNYGPLTVILSLTIAGNYYKLYD